MNNVIDNFLLENINENPVIKLELLKIKVREESIQFSKLLAMQRRNDKINLYHNLNECESALSKDPDNIELLTKCNKLKLDIEIMEQNKLKGFQFRLKQKYITDMDKNSKFFLNLEKSQASSKIIPSLLLDDGNLITDQFSILNAQKEYYQNLYNKEDADVNTENNIDTFLSNCNTPTLTEIERDICEGLVTKDEISKALQMMNND